jgi:hypothetical protein
MLDYVRAAAGRVAEVFDLLGVPYVIGGSVASGIYGNPRSTNDADFIADVRPEHIDGIVEHLSEEFYTDREMIADAIRRESSFNVIHYDLGFKVDVFVCGTDAFKTAQLARRVRLKAEDGRSFEIASPEDTIVAKLRWFRMGGGVSERQWRDVLEVLCVQGPGLDEAYLEATAESLGVADLLAKAREEAARPADPL